MRDNARSAIVAEDQEFYLAGLTSLLKRKLGFRRLSQARSLVELERSLKRQPVDFVLMSATLPGVNGCETISTLREKYPRLRVAVIGHAADRGSVLAMLAGGVHGFIPRQLHPEEMAAALKFIGNGHIFVPASMADRNELSAAPPQPHNSDLLKGLTARQVQILRLLVEGLSNKSIARELAIAPATVKVHINAAFRTLGVHNRRSATAAYLSRSTAEPNQLRLRAS